MRFKSEINDLKLVMFERTLMPESIMKKDDKGKTVFEKTGQKTEMTTYTFRDGFGEKLVFLSKENGYRSLEGETVDIELEVSYDEFNRKSKVALISVEKTKKAKA